MFHEKQRHLSLRPLSGYRQVCDGEYAEYEVALPTWPPGSTARYEPVVHALNATMRVYLSHDRSGLRKSVTPYYNQSYVLTMRFEGRQSGWSFDETMRFHEVPPPVNGCIWPNSTLNPNPKPNPSPNLNPNQNPDSLSR